MVFGDKNKKDLTTDQLVCPSIFQTNEQGWNSNLIKLVVFNCRIHCHAFNVKIYCGMTTLEIRF